MDSKTVVDTYIAAWNETDEEQRKELIAQCWSDSGTYTDPVADVSGPAALSDLINGFHGQMPEASIVVTTGIDQHHDHIRFGWRLEGAAQAIDGIDVGRLASDGRLASIVGFWGTNPPEP
jgi:hypothetical protein